MTFYANEQWQAAGAIGTLDTGGIGFFVGERSSAASSSAILIAYQGLKLWQL